MISQELGPERLTILAVALDSAGEEAARAFAEVPDAADVPPPVRRLMGWSDELWEAASRPTYPCLLDRDHRVARLFDLTNVPSAVWIDEEGRIVRPPEHAGAYDMLREIDLETFAIPEAAAAEGAAQRARYVDAVRDWVEHGSESRYVLPAEEVARRMPGPSLEDSQAAAQFRIGAYLTERGALADAQPFFEEAVRLRPESWTFRRQKIAAASPEAIGELAASEEFWEAVHGLGEKSYYDRFEG